MPYFLFQIFRYYQIFSLILMSEDFENEFEDEFDDVEDDEDVEDDSD